MKTLADFSVPIALSCFHCDKKLPKAARVQRQHQGNYVIVTCPSCGYMTPFYCEKSLIPVAVDLRRGSR